MEPKKKIQKFEDLIAWQKARDLALEIYKMTSKGSFSKDFGLKDQIQRAAVSVMSNIAEGFERYSSKEFQHFLAIARGSAAEVRSQLHLACSLEYISDENFKTLHNSAIEVSKLIGGLRNSIKK